VYHFPFTDANSVEPTTDSDDEDNESIVGASSDETVTDDVDDYVSENEVTEQRTYMFAELLVCLC
jgi:hypothetical protein